MQPKNNIRLIKQCIEYCFFNLLRYIIYQFRQLSFYTLNLHLYLIGTGKIYNFILVSNLSYFRLVKHLGSVLSLGVLFRKFLVCFSWQHHYNLQIKNFDPK